MSNIVTQLQRAGAPGVPERVSYMNPPVESMRAMNPQRWSGGTSLERGDHSNSRVFHAAPH